MSLAIRQYLWEVLVRRMPSGYSICTEIRGNGAGTGMVIIRQRHKPIREDRPKEPAEWCVGVHGTPMRTIAALPPASALPRSSGMIRSVFVSRSHMPAILNQAIVSLDKSASHGKPGVRIVVFDDAYLSRPKDRSGLPAYKPGFQLSSNGRSWAIYF